eukprot:IDg949t1
MSDSKGSLDLSSNGSGSTVKQTMLVGLEAPKLKNLSITDFIEFKRKRKVYEETVEEKNKENGFDIKLASYKISVEENVLHMMWKAKWIKAPSIDLIEDEQIKECIESDLKDLQTI